MLAAIWWNEYSLLALLFIILIFALPEFFRLKLPDEAGGIKILAITGASIILVINFAAAAGWIRQVYMLLDIAILLGLQFLLLFRTGDSFSGSVAGLTFGLIYILLPLSVIPFICFLDGHYDHRLIFGFFFLLWTYDSFAYLTGVLTGKHRILPSVSPKKSWEGLAGGLLFSLGAAYIIPIFFTRLTFAGWAGLAVIVVITGTAGDFIESAMKRNAGVKDSGRFLPGHGGVLDRFDSVLFSIPFVYLYLTLIIA